MADQKKTILELDAGTLATLKATGYVPVSISGKTYKMALKDITDVTDAKADASALTSEVTRATAAEALKANTEDIPTKTSELTNDGDGTTGSVLVKSTDITQVVKVSALPETPDENTLYLIVEEATTTSETEA